MPALHDLDAHLLKHSVETAPPTHGRKREDGTMQWGGFPVDVFEYVEALGDADGISFLCPKCFTANGGPVGTHGIHVYFEGRNVPAHLGKNSKGETVRWSVSGTCLADLCLSPSILLEGPGCGWHGFIGRDSVPPGHAA